MDIPRLLLILVFSLTASFTQGTTQSVDNFMLPELMRKLSDLETTLEEQCRALKRPSAWPSNVIDMQKIEQDVIDIRTQTQGLTGNMDALEKNMEKQIKDQDTKIVTMIRQFETSIASMQLQINNQETKFDNAIKSIRNQIDKYSSRFLTLQESVAALQQQASSFQQTIREMTRFWPASTTEKEQHWVPSTKSPQERGYSCNNGGWCVKNNRMKKTWDEAKRACEEDGAMLATISTKDNQELTDKLISDNSFTWIGLRQYRLYEFKWADGKTLGRYRPWGEWRGTNESHWEDCVYIYNGGKQWGQYSCEGKAPYVCQVTI